MVISASFGLAPSSPLAKKLRARTAGFLGCIPHSSVRRAEESMRGCRETWKDGKEDEESSSGRVGRGEQQGQGHANRVAAAEVEWDSRAEWGGAGQGSNSGKGT